MLIMEEYVLQAAVGLFMLYWSRGDYQSIPVLCKTLDSWGVMSQLAINTLLFIAFPQGGSYHVTNGIHSNHRLCLRSVD